MEHLLSSTPKACLPSHYCFQYGAMRRIKTCLPEEQEERKLGSGSRCLFMARANHDCFSLPRPLSWFLRSYQSQKADTSNPQVKRSGQKQPGLPWTFPPYPASVDCRCPIIFRSDYKAETVSHDSLTHIYCLLVFFSLLPKILCTRQETDG